ncbi:hypothetical protein, partial [Solicola sp. PLA-1-18]|uniref:hypothetical protein n=1 Tax=Solicola sp. PLA-1-18 TaxID=3380532 RepID=UPI003B791982
MKHQEGTATIESGFLVITFEGWTAPAAKKQHSPLRIDLSTVVAVEQRLKGADRTIRIVTEDYVPAAKLTDDPHVLRFIPVRESTKAEVDQ